MFFAHFTGTSLPKCFGKISCQVFPILARSFCFRVRVVDVTVFLQEKKRQLRSNRTPHFPRTFLVCCLFLFLSLPRLFVRPLWPCVPSFLVFFRGGILGPLSPSVSLSLFPSFPDWPSGPASRMDPRCRAEMVRGNRKTPVFWLMIYAYMVEGGSVVFFFVARGCVQELSHCYCRALLLLALFMGFCQTKWSVHRPIFCIFTAPC